MKQLTYNIGGTHLNIDEITYIPINHEISKNTNGIYIKTKRPIWDELDNHIFYGLKANLSHQLANKLKQTWKQ